MGGGVGENWILSKITWPGILTGWYNFLLQAISFDIPADRSVCIFTDIIGHHPSS